MPLEHGQPPPQPPLAAHPHPPLPPPPSPLHHHSQPRIHTQPTAFRLVDPPTTLRYPIAGLLPYPLPIDAQLLLALVLVAASVLLHRYRSVLPSPRQALALLAHEPLLLVTSVLNDVVALFAPVMSLAVGLGLVPSAALPHLPWGPSSYTSASPTDTRNGTFKLRRAAAAAAAPAGTSLVSQHSTLSRRQQRKGQQQQQQHAKRSEIHGGYHAGLRNTGNTCFFNSVLQSLASLGGFKQHLARVLVEAERWDVPTPVVDATAQLMLDLNSRLTRRTALNPTQLVDALARLPSRPTPSTGGGGLGRSSGIRTLVSAHQQQDAHELLVLLLDAIQNEVLEVVSARATSIRTRREGLHAALSSSLRSGGAAEEHVWPAASSSSPSSSSCSSTSTASLPLNVEGALSSPFQALVAQRTACGRCGYVEAVRHFTAHEVSVNAASPPSVATPRGVASTLEACLYEWSEVEEVEWICHRCSLMATLARLSAEVKRLEAGAGGGGGVVAGGMTTTKKRRLRDARRHQLFVAHALRANVGEEELGDFALRHGLLSASLLASLRLERPVSAQSTKQVMLARPPRLLVVHLNRSSYSATSARFGSGATKVEARVEFGSRLDVGVVTTGGTTSLEPRMRMSIGGWQGAAGGEGEGMTREKLAARVAAWAGGWTRARRTWWKQQQKHQYGMARASRDAASDRAGPLASHDDDAEAGWSRVAPSGSKRRAGTSNSRGGAESGSAGAKTNGAHANNGAVPAMANGRGSHPKGKAADGVGGATERAPYAASMPPQPQPQRAWGIPRRPPTRYRLASMVVHYGGHSFGHYVSFRTHLDAGAGTSSGRPNVERRGPDSDSDDDDDVGDEELGRDGRRGDGFTWARVSDESVEPCGVAEALAQDPVMLFYELEDEEGEVEGEEHGEGAGSLNGWRGAMAEGAEIRPGRERKQSAAWHARKSMEFLANALASAGAVEDSDALGVAPSTSAFGDPGVGGAMAATVRAAAVASAIPGSNGPGRDVFGAVSTPTGARIVQRWALEASGRQGEGEAESRGEGVETEPALVTPGRAATNGVAEHGDGKAAADGDEGEAFALDHDHDEVGQWTLISEGGKNVVLRSERRPGVALRVRKVSEPESLDPVRWRREVLRPLLEGACAGAGALEGGYSLLPRLRRIRLHPHGHRASAVAPDFLERLCEHVEPQRTEERRREASIDTRAPEVWSTQDLTAGEAVCVEIKPKFLSLPNARFLSRETERYKTRYSRYRMHRVVKSLEAAAPPGPDAPGKRAALPTPEWLASLYEPVELCDSFDEQLRRLWQGWASSSSASGTKGNNNLKVFVRGRLLHSNEPSDVEALSEFLGDGNDLPSALASQSRRLVPVLRALQTLQRGLDALDVEGLAAWWRRETHHAFGSSEDAVLLAEPTLEEYAEVARIVGARMAASGAAPAEDGMAKDVKANGVDALRCECQCESADVLRGMTLRQALLAFLLGAMFKDCSVMIRLERRDTVASCSSSSGSSPVPVPSPAAAAGAEVGADRARPPKAHATSAPRRREQGEGRRSGSLEASTPSFDTHAYLVDLDPKPVTRLAGYLEQDAQIVRTFSGWTREVGLS